MITQQLNDRIKAELVASNTDLGEEIICSVLADKIEEIAIDFAIEQIKGTIKLYHTTNYIVMGNGGTATTIGEIGLIKIKQLENRKSELEINKEKGCD